MNWENSGRSQTTYAREEQDPVSQFGKAVLANAWEHEPYPPQMLSFTVHKTTLFFNGKKEDHLKLELLNSLKACIHTKLLSSY